MNAVWDEILHISVARGCARALVARTTDMVREAERVHGAAPAATIALGQTLTAAALLGCQLKGDDHAVTLQIKGAGALGSLVCTAHGDGTVKGYVDEPTVAQGGVELPGYMRVIRDARLKEPYIGQVSLQTGEIARDLAHYLSVSEGRPAAVSLGVLLRDGAVAGAAGLLVEPMPGCPDAVLTEIEHCLPLMCNVSSDLSDLGDLRAFASFVFTGIPIEVLASSAPRFCCDCSRARIEEVLLSMGRAELMDMIRTQKGAELVCHFCNTKYQFDAGELSALLFQAR